MLVQIFDSKVVTAKIFKPLKLYFARLLLLTHLFMAQREVLSQWEFIDRLNREDMRGEEIAMAKVAGRIRRTLRPGVSMLPHTLRGESAPFSCGDLGLGCRSIGRYADVSALGGPQAVEFYLACGFKVIGTMEPCFSPGILMRKFV